MTLIRFSTEQFDFAAEPRPSINPIYGHSLAELLRKGFEAQGYEVDSEPDEEDWGWYFYMKLNGQSYMVGTCAYVETDPDSENLILPTEPVEHLVQFDKVRSFKETLLRRNKFTSDDPIISITETILKREITNMTEYSKEP